jgi:hypothetical protein
MTATSATSPITADRPSTFTEKTEKDALPPRLEANEYGDAEENYNPKSLKFWLIIISVYLSFFLVALDRMIVGM